MLPAIIYDDAHPRLAPLTDLRPSFDVRTGARTTLDRLQYALKLDVIGLSVPPHHADLTRERHIYPVNELLDGEMGPQGRPVLVVNGRCVLPPPQLAALPADSALVDAAGTLIGGWLSADAAVASIVDPHELSRRVLESAPRRETLASGVLLERPWSVRTFRDRSLAMDLTAMLAGVQPARPPHGVTFIGSPASIFIAPDANVSPSVVIDAEHGPVVISAHAVVRPGAILVGPVYIGSHATVLDRTLVKANSAIGPSCKVAGEVGGTIFQGFANKAHDGHLGDSYVGEWANLGAGTTNSNLLNTYSEIAARAASDSPNERTGETFLGAIIGDHAKFAICTRIMAGSVVHTGAMWAAAAPVSGPVDAFSWVTDAGKRGYRLDKFVEVARAVMARRKLEPSPAYLTRLRELHERASAASAGKGA